MRVRSLVGVAATALLFVACGDDGDVDGDSIDDDPTTDIADGPTIDIADFAFDGPSVVAVGDAVTAVNRDGVGHTWTSDEGLWDSGNLSTDESFTHTFDEPGSFSFICEIHPQMTGEITVEG